MEQSATYPAPFYSDRRSARISAAIALPIESQREFAPQGLGLVRGLMAGVVMEVAAGLCLYAIWLGWHLIR